MHTDSVEVVTIGTDPSGPATHMVMGYTSHINSNKDEYWYCSLVILFIIYSVENIALAWVLLVDIHDMISLSIITSI